jgi:hypothetical protein
LTLEEFEKKANNFMNKRGISSKSNTEIINDVKTFEERANKFLSKRNSPTLQKVEPQAPQIKLSDIPKIDINAIAEQSRGGMTSAQIRQQANLMQQENQRIEQEQKAKEQAEWQAKTPIQKVGTVVGKTLATPVAALGELGTGVGRGFEGFADLGITAGGLGIGAMRKTRLENSQKMLDKLIEEGKISGKDAEEWQRKIEEGKKDDKAIDEATAKAIEYPVAENLLGKANREFSQNYSYLPTKVADVSKTVGTILPSLATGTELMASKPLQALASTGKVGTKIASTASMIPFMGQAAGMSTEEALREGADLKTAAQYGALSGAVEGMIEAISGGIGGTASNKLISKLAPKTISKISNKVIAKYLPRLLDVGVDLAGEGAEEWLSTYINPYIKRLTYDEKAELSTSEERMEAFVDGVLASILLKGATSLVERTTPQGEVEALPEMDIATQNQLKSLGIQETNVPNVTQNVPSQQINTTLPTQAEMAQKANTEQITQNRLSSQYFANNKVVYNNDGTVNRIKTGENIFENNEGKSITKTIKDYLENHINEYASIIESGQKVYLGEDLPDEYAHSKNTQRLSKGNMLAKGRAATGIKEIIENASNRTWTKNLKEKHNTDAKYGFYKYDTTFSFDYNGKEKIYTGKVLIRNDANGKKYLYDILDIKPKKIDNDLPPVASNSKSSAMNDGSNSSSINSIYQNDNFVKSYISPVSDIEKANDFVSKATVNDIETLQKMVEEAEKNPDRIDLQFFAEKTKKKIEYLTKSQRYQRNKIATLANKLEKTYGIGKEQISNAINEYVNAYNNDLNVIEARDVLLNKLNSNGVLGEYAAIEISNDIDNLNKELDTVRRYETDKTKNEQNKEQAKIYYKLNKETVSKLYQLKKEYQANADKAMTKILLTKSDSIQLDRLLKEEITFDELPKSVNVEQIRKAYNAKKPLMDVNKEIKTYANAIKQQRNEKMRKLTQNSAQWKDKKNGFAYARETQERNISDIAPEQDAQKINKEIFEPIHKNEAEATRYKNELRNKIKDLDISIKPKYEVSYTDEQGNKTEKVSESGLVQLYGEGKISDEILKDLGADIQKIKNAVSIFREIYNDLYNKTNDVLVQNGYAPVEFRKDYFPHFEETKPDTLIGKALNKLGFKLDTKELPTDIAGLTHTFRPGKKWVSNFLQRTTDVATYDAIKGFDNYLDSVADVIYHTDDIQNLRAYENALRYQHSDEVVKEQINEVINMDIANEMKQSMIDQLYANAENSLAHYVTDLRAFTDSLAGKKSLEDRTMEHNLGRGIYNITKNVQSRVSANMVGANISSALTNFIPITQATAVIDGKNLIQATYDTVKNALKSDGFAEQSDFLTNRRGSDKLYKTTVDKLAGATNLMQVFDNITSEIINRGRYYQNVTNGMTEADARTEADQMTGKIMADRSKGSMPTIFNQSSPVTKLLTAFQLEVNNQYSYLLKDIPKEYKDKSIGNLVWAFAKFFIGAWLYNELYEEITGRRAALDPINIVSETVGDVREGKKVSKVASELATEVVEEIPFVGGLIGGGRLPISNALPDIGETAKATISLFEEGDKKKALQTLGSELSKPVFYILPPFGGGQLKKTVEGISTFAKGGNYGVNAQGQETLKYPVEQNLGNFVKSALFGKWSTKGAVDYVDNGFKALSANQTEGYEKAKKAGISDEQFYNAYNAQNNVGDLGNLTSLVKKNEIDKVTKTLPPDKRRLLYEVFNVAKSEWDNTRNVYPQEIKAKKEELAREKLKKKEK